jgi:hypothetical protein
MISAASAAVVTRTPRPSSTFRARKKATTRFRKPRIRFDADMSELIPETDFDEPVSAWLIHASPWPLETPIWSA